MPLLDALVLLLALLAAGALAGFFAGLFGVGGGFVVVPALLLVFTSLAPTPHDLHVAIGTSLATIIVTSLRSVQAHHIFDDGAPVHQQPVHVVRVRGVHGCCGLVRQ